MNCTPVDINQHPVCMAIARTVAQQSKGLSGKKSIQDNYAMLFDMRSLGFNNRAFWTMQGMKFAIDMIFIKDNKILTITYAVPPCKYSEISKCSLFGGFPVDYVIETKSGNANKWGLHINQKINITVPNTEINKNKKEPLK